MISILIGLLILALVIYVANLIVGQLGFPPVVKQIVYIIIGLVALVWLLDTLGIYHLALR